MQLPYAELTVDGSCCYRMLNSLWIGARQRALADATTGCQAAAQELEDIKALISSEAVQFENQVWWLLPHMRI